MGMIARQYNTNLNNALNNVSEASNRADTLRKFNKASEDPFSAAKGFALRREFAENASYQTAVEDANDQMDTVQSVMMSIHKVVQDTNSTDGVRAVTGTMNASNRKTYADKIRQMQKSILGPANTQFGNSYIFAGSGAGQPPFSVGKGGKLLYRGIDVDTGEIAAGSTVNYNGAQITLGDKKFDDFSVKINTADNATPAISVDSSSKVLTFNLPTGATNNDIKELLKQNSTVTDGATTYDLTKADLNGDLNCPVDISDQTNKAISNIGMDGLEKLANEPSFINMGLGLSFKDANTINDQSVYDSGVPGISFLGYGTTKDGISNNIYNLMGQISDVLESDDFTMEKMEPYLNKLDEQSDYLLGKLTECGTKTNFLEVTKSNLIDTGDKVNKKLVDTEYVDFVEAFMDWTMQKFSYEKAVKIGADILQPSFIDFMK